MKIGSKKGFTLIELLVVIAIIGILAVALLPTILGAPAKGRDAARKSLLSSISTAIEARNLEKGGYPLGQACTSATLTAADNAELFSVKPYAQGGSFPVDPLGANGPNFGKTKCGRGDFLFTQSSGGTTGKNYALVSYMELPVNANGYWDSAIVAGGDYSITTLASTATCDAFNSTTPFAPKATSCVFVMQK